MLPLFTSFSYVLLRLKGFIPTVTPAPTILAEDGTKTSKIRKLLLLGLTHREIANLVTRGNRGFVWNVYKRMRDEGLIVSAGTPTATTTPELDYSFRRKFGVEIEAYNCTCQRLVRELTEAGIEVASERYNHDLRPHWKLVTDSSLNGNDTFELVSPILEGEDGLEKRRGSAGCWTPVMSRLMEAADCMCT